MSEFFSVPMMKRDSKSEHHTPGISMNPVVSKAGVPACCDLVFSILSESFPIIRSASNRVRHV